MERRRRSEEEANLLPWFLAKNGSQFFKIIHSAIITSKRMGLPEKFVRKFGNQLADVVVLRVPNDKTWHVKLKKAGGKIWLGKGWEKFVEYHLLSVGQFLVFRYDGNSNFHVLIFEMSGNEIHYPCNNSHINLEEPSDSEELHVVPENKMDETDEDEAVEVLNVSPPNEHDLCSKRNKSIDVPINIREFSTSLRNDALFITPETKKAIESAKAFKSKHPFYVLVMRPSYVKSNYSVVPTEFVKRYMPKNSASIKLKASNGRTWTVNYIRNNENGLRTTLSKGWKAFASENNLKDGDVCVFELINNVDFVLEVSIFHVPICSNTDLQRTAQVPNS